MNERWQNEIEPIYGPIIKEDLEERGFDVGVQLKAMCRLAELEGSIPRVAIASPEAHKALGDPSSPIGHGMPPGYVILAT